MRLDPSATLAFMKMHGLGNDFVVIDARNGTVPVIPDLARALGDRHMGVGFDQLVVVSRGPSDAQLTFYNSDGSMAGACGNATRCVARWLMTETGRQSLSLTTARGTLEAHDVDGTLTAVNMGAPLLDWQSIPLSHAVDTLSLPIEGTPVATGMGNPHCTFFVPDAEAIDLETLGPKFETHPLFPDRTNVQFAHVIAPNRLRMRVWERGVGVTLASGSSSCAVAVAATRRGLTDASVEIELDGGVLRVDWRDDGVWMTGPTAHVYDGTISREFLAEVFQ